ncbi:MAG: sigma-70 family RNA polymerase sigma factor [Planctomycetes bacterium]|nr:sigma-70 family RNA polymerase sigma factor [Planctomycetota bacterium]
MASLCWMFTMPAGTTTLQQLLDEAAFRDGSIYDKLLEHASERLRALSRKSLRGFPRLASLVQTDDVLQEALLRLHSSLNKVRPSSLRGFFGLAAIQIRRNLIDLTRHLLGPEGYGTHVRTGPISQENEPVVIEAVDRWICFNDLIDTLPAEEREVVDLQFVHSMTQEEVSELLGISLSTVKRRWISARLKLGTLIQQLGTNENNTQDT